MSIRVERPGLLTTVQDLGRRAQRHGVARGGAMDTRAARVANLLVGNADSAAVLETTLLGPTLLFEAPHLAAVCGADGGAALNGISVAPGRPFAVAAGARLELGAPRRGCRAYIAVAGGIDVPQVMGSRATDLRAGFGGLAGRPLAAGDSLDIGVPGAAAERRVRELAPAAAARWGAGRSLLHHAADPALVRIVEGPEHDRFSAGSVEALTAEAFTVTAQSNRMGYRLAGARLELAEPLEMISSPVSPGTVQVPPAGDPIVLMADAQTVGGYPRIAHVISVDLPVLAQLAPGATLRFQRVTLGDAQHLYLQQEHDLRMFAAAVSLR